MTRATDIAWFAGIFEGEGTFELSKRSTARMTIAMSDRDVIERVNAIFPTGLDHLGSRRNEEPHRLRQAAASGATFKPLYVWRLGESARIVECITAVLPLLGERRSERAKEVLAHIANRQQPGQPRTTHCRRGHSLTPDNLIRRGGKSPYVRCRICAVEQQHAYVERRRAARLLG